MPDNNQEYLNKYLRENYYKPSIRVPIGKRKVIESVALKTGKSINTLFIEAFEKCYKVDLTFEAQIQKYAAKKDGL